MPAIDTTLGVVVASCDWDEASKPLVLGQTIAYTALPANLTFPATPAQPTGDRYWAFDLTAAAATMPRVAVICPAGTAPDATKRWGLRTVIAYRFSSDTLDAATDIIQHGSAKWTLQRNTDNKLQLVLNGGSTLVGDTALTKDTDYQVHVWYLPKDSGGSDLATPQWVVEVVSDPAGTPSWATHINEQASVTGAAELRLIPGDSNVGASSGTDYIMLLGHWWEDADDRYGVIWCDNLETSANGTYTSWTNGEAEFDDVSSTGTGNSPDDDATYIEAASASNVKETATLATSAPRFTSADTPIAVGHYSRKRKTDSKATVTYSMIATDGTNDKDAEQANGGTAGTTYSATGGSYDTAPDGTAWAADDLIQVAGVGPKVEFGVRGLRSAGELRVTAQAVILAFEASGDSMSGTAVDAPPAGGGGGARTYAQWV